MNVYDFFYTYLVIQEEFADVIAAKGKKGAIFMVYGFRKILAFLAKIPCD